MVMAAAVATQVGMSASSFLCPSSIISNQVELPNCAPSTLVVCQRDSLERRTAAAHVSRRVLAVVSASAAATLGVFTQPEAAQAKRNKPPPEEKKVELEEKSLGVNEQRALANARRKDAMKASVGAAKAKAKSISSPQSERVDTWHH